MRNLWEQRDTGTSEVVLHIRIRKDPNLFVGPNRINSLDPDWDPDPTISFYRKLSSES